MNSKDIEEKPRDPLAREIARDLNALLVPQWQGLGRWLEDIYNRQEEIFRRLDALDPDTIMKAAQAAHLLATGEQVETNPLVDPPSQEPRSPYVPPSDIPDCPACGEPMRMREGKYGKFWGCSMYPECKEIVNIDTPPWEKKGKSKKKDESAEQVEMDDGDVVEF